MNLQQLQSELQDLLEKIDEVDALWLGLDPKDLTFSNPDPTKVKDPTGTLKRWIRRLKPYVENGLTIFPAQAFEKPVFTGPGVSLGKFKEYGLLSPTPVYWDKSQQSYCSGSKPVDVTEGLFICACPASYVDRDHGGITLNELRVANLAAQLQSRSTQEKLDFLLSIESRYSYSKVAAIPNTVSLSLVKNNDAQTVKAWFTLGENCRVITPSREYEVRHRAYISQFGEVSAETLLTLFAFEIADKPCSQSDIDGLVNFLTQVWEEEDNYGRPLKTNDQLRVLRANSASLVQVEDNPQGTYPYYKLVNANNSTVVCEALQYYLEQGIPCMPDKYAQKRIIVGQKGVNALWVGMKDGRFRTINEVKMSKFLNRGYNSLAIPAGEGQVGSSGYRSYREAALHIGSAQDADNAIRIYGDSSRCLFTNLRSLQNGSGGALCQREFAYSVSKTIRGTLTESHLPKDTTLEQAQAFLEGKLKTLCQQELELEAGKRHVLLTFRGLEILVWDELNQPAKVDRLTTEYSVRRLATSSSLQITLTVTFHASDECVKLRGLGIKAVTTPSTAEVFDQNGNRVEWEVLFGTETQKGVAARLHLYSEYLMKKHGKPSYYNPSEGTLEYWNGREWKIQDLGSGKAPIYTWIKKNMQPLRVRGWMALPYFKAMVAAHAELPVDQDGVVEAALQHPNNQDLHLVDQETGELTSDLSKAVHDGAVFIEEHCEGILGDYVGQIELTTRRESSSRQQSATLEYQALTWATHPNLGERLINTGIEAEEAVTALTAMVSNDPSFLYVKQAGPDSVTKKLKVDSLKMDSRLAHSLNQSKFHLGKNELFYKDVVDPFWAFSSPEDKRKKFSPGVLLSNDMPLTERDMTSDDKENFLDLCNRVSKHMLISVGTGYGMASAITLKAVLVRHALLQAKTVAEAEPLLEQFKTIQSVVSRVWEHKYEDMDLAGLNITGEAFNQLLQSCVTGRYMFFVDGKAHFLSKEETLKKISEAYTAAKGLPLPIQEADLLLWSFQMARGTTAMEKNEKLAKWANNLLEDILLCAAFRRCGQGLYARYVTAEDEANEFVATGQSPWTYLGSNWEAVEAQMPAWLARKMWVTMNVHEQLNSCFHQGDYITPALEEVQPHIPQIHISRGAANSTESVGIYVKGQYEVTTFEALEGAFQLLAPAKEGEEPMTLTSREIFKAAHRRYPYGVVLVSTPGGSDKNVRQYINFGAFLKLGAFTSGGFCTGSAYALLELMMMVSRYDQGETGRDQKLNHKFESFRGMMKSWVTRGAVKKLARSGPNFVSSKVLTSHENDVNPIEVKAEDGELYSVPVVLANPNDDLVKQGYLKEGNFYGVSRTPMVSRFYAVLLLSEDVPIGSIKVDAMTWAMSNRGDGDGDPITLEDVSNLCD
jgi:hypothetical protein